MSKTKTFSLMGIVLIFSLACMTTAALEEVGTAAASTPPSPGAPTAQDKTEDFAGAVFEPTTEPAHMCATVTASEALHLRQEPDERSAVIEYLLAGEQVTVLDIGARWWKVETISHKTGWANAKYLQEGKCP